MTVRDNTGTEAATGGRTDRSWRPHTSTDLRRRRVAQFVDEAGRDIEIRTTGASESDALVEMYDSLDSDDRAQGVPPLTGDRIQSWLADLLAEGHNLFFKLKPDQKSLIKTF